MCEYKCNRAAVYVPLAVYVTLASIYTLSISFSAVFCVCGGRIKTCSPEETLPDISRPCVSISSRRFSPFVPAQIILRFSDPEKTFTLSPEMRMENKSKKMVVYK